MGCRFRETSACLELVGYGLGASCQDADVFGYGGEEGSDLDAAWLHSPVVQAVSPTACR
ncbi:hypothetical protein BOSEA31B_12911 [Hyphomicrobiales bacterium]|nr:hypothetical protein BOSEA31B_12911 [Hyphomicrobiales bacterium]CAH1698684.1 hypothetical protein BOSEA1005_11737 [Hyphomicrobiales bacterium]CAI0342330.1 hypothetical protein BO1005MUT1_180109 [Hyphomicrobiales bacterium]